MTEKSTPLWRCKSCDHKFETPEIWPGDSAQSRKLLADPERVIEDLSVCPRCHSSSIERWK